MEGWLSCQTLGLLGPSVQPCPPVPLLLWLFPSPSKSSGCRIGREWSGDSLEKLCSLYSRNGGKKEHGFFRSSLFFMGFQIFPVFHGFSVFPVGVCLEAEVTTGCFYLPYSLRLEVFSKFHQCFVIAGLRYGFSKQGWEYIYLSNKCSRSGICPQYLRRKQVAETTTTYEQTRYDNIVINKNKRYHCIDISRKDSRKVYIE